VAVFIYMPLRKVCKGGKLFDRLQFADPWLVPPYAVAYNLPDV